MFEFLKSFFGNKRDRYRSATLGDDWFWDDDTHRVYTHISHKFKKLILSKSNDYMERHVQEPNDEHRRCFKIEAFYEIMPEVLKEIELEIERLKKEE